MASGSEGQGFSPRGGSSPQGGSSPHGGEAGFPSESDTAASSQASTATCKTYGPRIPAASTPTPFLFGRLLTRPLNEALLEPLFPEIRDPEVERQWLPEHLVTYRSEAARTESMKYQSSVVSGTNTPSPRRISTTSHRPATCVSEHQTLQVGSRSRTIVETEAWLAKQQQRARVLVRSRLFGAVSCSVILLNAVVTGVQLHGGVHRDFLGGATPAFLGYYLLEVLVRIFGADGLAGLLEDNWLMFDLSILFMEFLAVVVLPSYLRTGKSLMLVRLMRLAPLARMLRSVAQFRVLKVLVRTLMGSLGLMINTVVLLTLFLYILSVLGTEVVGMHAKVTDPVDDADAEFRDIANKYFGSVPGTMLTLVQFVCLDTVAAIYRPLVVRDSSLALYFVAVMLVIPILLMNLVTGIIVSSTQDHIQLDKAESLKHEKIELANTLRGIFARLDEDKCGRISRSEILNISNKDRAFLICSTSMQDPLTIFNALDPELTGTLDCEEFCNGVWQLATSKVNIEVQQMEKQVNSVFKRMPGVLSNQAKMRESLERARALQRGLRRSLQSQCLEAAGGEAADHGRTRPPPPRPARRPPGGERPGRPRAAGGPAAAGGAAAPGGG